MPALPLHLANPVKGTLGDAEVSRISRGKPVSTSNTANNSALPPRPKFAPSPCSYPQSSANSYEWIPVIKCPAHHPVTAFETAMEQMVLHPERSSGLILRAEIISDTDAGDEATTEDVLEDSQAMQELNLQCLNSEGGSGAAEWRITRRVELNLLARKPGTDSSLRQSCVFLRRRILTSPEASVIDESNSIAHEDAEEESIVVMTPLVDKEDDVPHYHPPVKRIAFHWTPQATLGSPLKLQKGVTRVEVEEQSVADPQDAPIPRPLGQLQIAIMPFQPLVIAPPVESCKSSEFSVTTTLDVLPNRLYRTCLHLLETADKFAWGAVVGYQKRVQTDAIIDKAAFQDLYLTLKSRHKHLDSRPAKLGSNQVVDVKRHVWKDVALAAFLMLLWKGMYPANEPGTHASEESEMEEGRNGGEVLLPNGKKLRLRSEAREWDAWGRPTGGFLDLGCGNGLLVHILVSEGYEGKGLELRSRKTWPTYPQRTQDRLIEHAIDPSSWFPTSLEEWRAGEWAAKEKCPIDDGVFLIGNHADEMTPWIPLLSLIPATPVPYLSLPCCLHTLSAMFTKATFKIPSTPSGPFTATLPIADDELAHGIDAGKYGAYVKWLGWVGVNCGWKWEKESLRIPSTRGWGIVARERWTDSAAKDWQCREYVMAEVTKVRTAGGFNVRKGEGSGHGGE